MGCGAFELALAVAVDRRRSSAVDGKKVLQPCLRRACVTLGAHDERCAAVCGPEQRQGRVGAAGGVSGAATDLRGPEKCR